jgi:hypothetical protein
VKTSKVYLTDQSKIVKEFADHCLENMVIGPVRPEAKNDLADKGQNLIRAASGMNHSLIVFFF